MKVDKKEILFLMTFALFLLFESLSPGCITSPTRESLSFQGNQPIYPPVPEMNGARYWIEIVDSLQPEFRWESSKEEGINYDLIIEEVSGSDAFTKRTLGCGRQEYYRENIKENYHKITKFLKRASRYCWSVRERRGNSVGKWSEYSSHLLCNRRTGTGEHPRCDESIIGVHMRYGLHFIFETP